MNDLCERCGGACCQVWRVVERDADTIAMAEGRTARAAGGEVFLRCECRHLHSGRCGVYLERPKLCRDMAVGGPACRSVLRALRPELFEEVNGGSHERHYEQERV